MPTRIRLTQHLSAIAAWSEECEPVRQGHLQGFQDQPVPDGDATCCKQSPQSSDGWHLPEIMTIRLT